MKLLLVSGYELGHQPYHLALAASHLLEEGHDVTCLDLAVQEVDPRIFEWPDAVAISVPMHTAARVGVEFARRIRRTLPEIPLAFYGLYAHVALDAFGSRWLQPEKEDESCVGHRDIKASNGDKNEVAIAGEYQAALRTWASSLEAGPCETGNRRECRSRVTFSLERQKAILPARQLLPPLESYARLAFGGERRLVGYLEATTGCSHRCRHCPVPIVYDGRLRKTAIEAVLADVQALLEAGASHITFGDPDFLNAPLFADALSWELHESFPDLTFDCTAKVEHILRHEKIWQRLHERGLLFVVSAFETTNGYVLSVLEKGHSPRDLPRAVEVLRRYGIEPRPSFLPFTPWTSLQDLLDILNLCVSQDLVANVDPVQYSLKLLVPKGSLLLNTPELRAILGDYDQKAMSFRWRAIDPNTIPLQKRIAEIASEGASRNKSLQEILKDLVLEVQNLSGCLPVDTPLSDASRHGSSFVDRVLAAADPEKVEARPRLTESWYCCAEPTAAQLQSACATPEVCA